MAKTLYYDAKGNSVMLTRVPNTLKITYQLPPMIARNGLPVTIVPDGATMSKTVPVQGKVVNYVYLETDDQVATIQCIFAQENVWLDVTTLRSMVSRGVVAMSAEDAHAIAAFQETQFQELHADLYSDENLPSWL